VDTLAAELEQLEREQRSRSQLEAAGRELNSLAQKMQNLALLIHKNGLMLNAGSPGMLTVYAAADSLSCPEFRQTGNTYSVVSVPIELSGYQDSPELSELVGSEPPSEEQLETNRLERQRLVIAAEVAQSEQALHSALAGGDARLLPSLDEAVRVGKARLEQLTSQLSELKS